MKLTELEVRALLDVRLGQDPWRHHPAHTRAVSQAIQRLKRKGMLTQEFPYVTQYQVTAEGLIELYRAGKISDPRP